MRNIKLLIEYDGSDYLGWQRQPQGPTVQEKIEEALKVITGEEVSLTASGRTDSGVHALGQVANFRTGSGLGPEEFRKGLNSALPRDIAILDAEEVPSEFHSQYSAKSKVYIYRILNRPQRSALLRKRVWHMPYAIDTGLLREAADLAVGEHDFRAFGQSGTEVKSTVRNLMRFTLKTDGAIIELEFEANGFLKRMVRLLTGTLVQAGKGRITPGEFGRILLSGEKNKFVFCAPPDGLYLKTVEY